MGTTVGAGLARVRRLGAGVRSWLATLRARVLLLVVLALVPLLALIGLTGREQRQVVTQRVEESTLRLALFTANAQAHLLEQTRQLLVVISHLPEVRPGQTAECNALVARIVTSHPFLVNVGAVDREGQAICSAVPLPAPLSLADRRYIQSALAGEPFGAGQYVIGRATGRATLNVGHPVRGAGGEIVGAVYAAINLQWVGEALEEFNLPRDSTLAIVDARGAEIWRYPSPDAPIEGNPPEAAVISLVSGHRADIVHANGPNNLPYIYAVAPLPDDLEHRGTKLVVGLPRDLWFADFDQLFLRNVVAVIAVTLLVAAVAWIGSGILLRQVRTLTRAARTLSAGDLRARARVVDGPAEVRALGHAFDSMADALQSRQHALERAELRLTAILELAAEAIVVVDADRRVSLFNRSAERMFQVSAAEVLGQPIEHLVPGAVVDALLARDAGSGPRQVPATELVANRLGDGPFPIEASLAVVDQDGEIAYTLIVRDVTQRRIAEARLQHMSTHDALTDLYNRACFEEELVRLDAAETAPVGVIVLDLDGLKHANDTWGHAAGDELLRRTAAVLRSVFRAEDLVARIGGDEFAILLPHVDAATLTQAVARIEAALSAHNASQPTMPLHFSIGAQLSGPGLRLLDALAAADAAMYAAKSIRRHENAVAGYD